MASLYEQVDNDQNDKVSKFLSAHVLILKRIHKCENKVLVDNNACISERLKVLAISTWGGWEIQRITVQSQRLEEESASYFSHVVCVLLCIGINGTQLFKGLLWDSVTILQLLDICPYLPYVLLTECHSPFEHCFLIFA